MDKQDAYTELASDLRISRVVTGLWQIADMERDDRPLDRKQAARAILQHTKQTVPALSCLAQLTQTSTACP